MTTQSRPSHPKPPPRALRAAFLTLVAVAALLSAGCGAVGHLTASSGDPTRGKALFKSTCGACHVLADAGTTGTVGPNLDDAFRPDKCQGFQESTIRDVVRGQIAYATSATGVAPNYSGRAVHAGPGTGMPDNLLRGQAAKDVAVYVAQVAGDGNCPTLAGAGTPAG